MLFLLLLLQSPQSNGAAAAPADDQGWSLVDGVALQAGDEVITLLALDRIVRPEIERNQDRIRNQADIDELTQLLVRNVVVRELEAQAGEDMGLRREDIDRIVQAQLDDFSSQSPSFIDELLQKGQDAFSWTEAQRKELHRYIWTRSQVGGESFGDKRPTRDRHIRPGELRAIYRANGADLDPDQVELQVLVLEVQAAGGVESARTILEAARERALSGEDFGALVQEIASERVETRGLTGLLALNTIADPALHAFAVRAEPGDIGEVLTVPARGTPHALVLPRLHQRVENDPPPFGDRKVQTFLREAFTKTREERILGRERAALVEEAFTWVSPGLRGAQRSPAAAAPAP
jgi:hypothetical protein